MRFYRGLLPRSVDTAREGVGRIVPAPGPQARPDKQGRRV